MVFSSPIFLFCFLPILLSTYYIFRKNIGAQNLLLLAASLLFYTWGEGFYLLLMLTSIIINYGAGILISRAQEKKAILMIGIIINILLLASFKYSNFIVDSLNVLLLGTNADPIFLAPVHLPIGISFFTFQAISYIVDVYRNHAPVQKNILHVALYISLFPQLIAGPIVRYNHISKQLTTRSVNTNDIYEGIRRFMIGLGKKVLIADNLALIVDPIFATPAELLSPQTAWIGAAAIMLQVYFDFSGYSDMAIGLGRMFGFSFKENFNYPFISRSITELWSRWHISMTTWFRDYLYLPLCGRRPTAFQIYRNMFLVFLLCGLWHGANWTFVLWGLVHGLFLTIERISKRSRLKRLATHLPRSVAHIYTIGMFLVAGVLFRSIDITYAGEFYTTMFGFHSGQQFFPMSNLMVCAFLAAIIGSTPCMKILMDRIYLHTPKAASAIHIVILLGMFGLCCLTVAAQSYQPFIYFRF